MRAVDILNRPVLTVSQVLKAGAPAGNRNAVGPNQSDKVQARSASDVIYAGATAQFPVQASSKPWATGEPVEFMYMPGGTHTICAGFRSASIKLTVQVDPEDAAKVLNGSLEQLRASQPKQAPFGCVEHEEKDASVWAKGFSAKADGVYLCAEPSELGARHVNGRIHRSWSPSFLTDADYAKASLVDGTYEFPDGVRGSESNPARITGCAFCLGTLTNRPAFREMSPVKAREAVKATWSEAAHQAAETPEARQKAAETRKSHLHQQRGDLTAIASHLETITNKDSNSSNHENLQEVRRRLTTVSSRLSSSDHPAARVVEKHVDEARQHIYNTSIATPAHEAAKVALGHVERARKHLFDNVEASQPSDRAAVKAAEPTSPAPFDAGALLDVARSLRVAHWNADTSTNEHEALGELYDSWEDGMDQLVEALCGKRGCEVSEPALGNTELADSALDALAGVKSGLDCEADADLCNIVADMENAVNKGRYLLKASQPAGESVRATWSDAARQAALESRRNNPHSKSAEQLSSVAYSAGYKATNKESYFKAADHHTAAAAMHTKAADYADDNEDKAHSMGASQTHRMAAVQHTQYATILRNMAHELKAKETRDMTASEVIQASGTSEGVKKSWQTRKANEFSGVAMKGEEESWGSEPMHAWHKQAASAHQEAAMHHLGSPDKVEFHLKQAKFHSDRAEQFGKHIAEYYAKPAGSRGNKEIGRPDKLTKASNLTPSHAVTASDILSKHSAPSGATAQPGGV